MYYYNKQDNDISITTGANTTISYAGVIQSNDGYGGYNTRFTLAGSTAEYHVHFGNGGSKIKVIRFKSGSNMEGDNIIKYGEGSLLTLKELAYECTGFNNHVALLNGLRNAIANAERLPNGNLA